MRIKSGWDQAPTRSELAGFAKTDQGTKPAQADPDAFMASRGIIPDDGDCQLTEYRNYMSSPVADPGAMVAGLQVFKNYGLATR